MPRRFRFRGAGGRFRPAPPQRRGSFSDSITPSLAIYGFYIMHQVKAAMRQWAEEAVEKMKSEAEWEDRTGDARSGLDWSIEENPVKPVVHLFHGVDYGLWLEVRWNGKYAIIMPTIESFGPKLMDYIENRI